MWIFGHRSNKSSESEDSTDVSVSQFPTSPAIPKYENVSGFQAVSSSNPELQNKSTATSAPITPAINLKTSTIFIITHATGNYNSKSRIEQECQIIENMLQNYACTLSIINIEYGHEYIRYKCQVQSAFTITCASLRPIITAAFEAVTADIKIYYLGNQCFPALVVESVPDDAEIVSYIPPLLSYFKSSYASAIQTAELQNNVLAIEQLLKSHGVNALIENVVFGPVSTRYELTVPLGISISRITARKEDIAAALGVEEIKINPVLGKQSVLGVEVPRLTPEDIMIGDIVKSDLFQNSESPLLFTLGKNQNNEPVLGDIGKMRHILMAGKDRHEQTMFLHCMLISMLLKAAPNDYRLIIADVTNEGFSSYNGIPHLLLPVITDYKRALGALQWLYTEVVRRFNMLQECHVRNITAYNQLCKNDNGISSIPHLVMIINELSDFFLDSYWSDSFQKGLINILTKASAVGVHLVLATTYFSSKTLPPEIKACAPTRIGFTVSTSTNSKRLLDISGAERLAGNGDMLILQPDVRGAMRIKGCTISDTEIDATLSDIKNNSKPITINGINCSFIDDSKISDSLEDDLTSAYDSDPQFAEAVEFVLDTKQASVSMLQRQLRLGYAHAARIVDEMEEKGIVGPFEGSKPRQLLITREQWNAMIGINPNATLPRK